MREQNRDIVDTDINSIVILIYCFRLYSYD